MGDPTNTNEIVVKDIKMPFLSMVIFMVKWAIASIPAVIIIVLIAKLIMEIIWGMMGGMGRQWF
jgi:hypothetical protein